MAEEPNMKMNQDPSTPLKTDPQYIFKYRRNEIGVMEFRCASSVCSCDGSQCGRNLRSIKRDVVEYYERVAMRIRSMSDEEFLKEYELR